jgi:hypothetical protein
MYDDQEVARVAHEVNRAYCQTVGDFSHKPWSDAPGWQKESAVAGVQFHRSNPDAGPAASHEAWLKQKTDDGWRYGSTKDPVAKTHPCLVPYDQLPREQQVKDFLFCAVVKALT